MAIASLLQVTHPPKDFEGLKVGGGKGFYGGGPNPRHGVHIHAFWEAHPEAAS